MTNSEQNLTMNKQAWCNLIAIVLVAIAGFGVLRSALFDTSSSWIMPFTMGTVLFTTIGRNNQSKAVRYILIPLLALATVSLIWRM